MNAFCEASCFQVRTADAVAVVHCSGRIKIGAAGDDQELPKEAIVMINALHRTSCHSRAIDEHEQEQGLMR